MITKAYPEISAAEAARQIDQERLYERVPQHLRDLNFDKLLESLNTGWRPTYAIFRRTYGPVLGSPGIQITIENNEALSSIPITVGERTVDFLRTHPDIRVEFEPAA